MNIRKHFRSRSEAITHIVKLGWDPVPSPTIGGYPPIVGDALDRSGRVYRLVFVWTHRHGDDYWWERCVEPTPAQTQLVAKHLAEVQS